MSFISWLLGFWSKYSSQIGAIIAAIILAIQTIVHIINEPAKPVVYNTHTTVYAEKPPVESTPQP